MENPKIWNDKTLRTRSISRPSGLRISRMVLKGKEAAKSKLLPTMMVRWEEEAQDASNRSAETISTTPTMRKKSKIRDRATNTTAKACPTMTLR